MRFKTYILLILLFICQFYFSQVKYSTVSNGSWSNSSTWDNGVPTNPLLEFDTIVINHDVYYNLNQVVQGVLIVDTNGVLTNNGSDMFIGKDASDQGEFYNYGSVSINSIKIEPQNCGSNDTKPVGHNFGSLTLDDELNVGLGCGSGFFFNHYNSNFTINNELHIDGYLCNEDTIFVGNLFRNHGGIVDCCGYIQTPEIDADENDNTPAIFMCMNMCTHTGNTPVISIGGSNYSFMPPSDNNDLVVDNDSTLICDFNQMGDSISFNPCNAFFSYSATSFCLDGGNISPNQIEDTSGYFSSNSSLLFIDSISGEIDVMSLDTGSYKVYHNLSDCIDSAQFSIYYSSFNYLSLSYCDGDSSALPILNGNSGGVFSTNLNSLLSFSNSLTGEIDILNSYDTIYSIYYDVFGCIDSAVFEIISDEFSYSSTSFCEGATNPVPIITGSSGGVFSSDLPLLISSSSGEITLFNAIDTSYTIYYDLLTCRDSFSIDVNSSSFSYTNSYFCNGDSLATPLINGTPGGVFNSNLDSVLIFQDSLMGTIEVSNSYDTLYNIYYNVLGCVDTFNLEIISNEFTYPSSIYCEGGLNPVPDITGSLGGIFTSDLPLLIDSNSGEINLLNAIDTSYVIDYDYLTCVDSFSLDIISSAFNYDSSFYCHYYTNPLPVVSGSQNGIFSSSYQLAIDSLSGLIDLQNSLDTIYSIYYQVGGCVDTFNLEIINTEFNYLDTVFCIGQAVDTLIVEGVNAGFFSVLPADISINNTSGFLNLNGALNLNYIVTNQIGSCSSNFSINVINPNFSYLDSVYCSFDSPVSAVLNNNGGVFSSFPSGLSFIDVSNGLIDFNNSLDMDYSVVYSLNNCADTFSLSVVNVNTNGFFNDSVCGFTYQFDNLQINDVSYLWSPLDTGLSISNLTVFNPIAAVSSEGNYLMNCVISKLGCDYSDTIALKFVDSIYLDLVDDLVLNQSSVELDPVSNGYYFQWESVSLNGGEIESPYNLSSTISNLVTGDYVFGITASNDVCPYKYEEILLFVDWVFIPNGFSPNGDGINDYFGLDGARQDIKFEIQIVNRWGELVYTSSNAFDKWDGTFNGIQIAEDTYFYFIELSDFQYKGAVDLRR